MIHINLKHSNSAVILLLNFLELEKITIDKFCDLFGFNPRDCFVAKKMYSNLFKDIKEWHESLSVDFTYNFDAAVNYINIVSAKISEEQQEKDRKQEVKEFIEKKTNK